MSDKKTGLTENNFSLGICSKSTNWLPWANDDDDNNDNDKDVGATEES